MSGSGLIVPRHSTVTRLDPACRNCRFFWTDPDGDLVCRRHPPTAQMFATVDELGQPALKPASTFPLVAPDFWCGEWETRGNGGTSG